MSKIVTASDIGDITTLSGACYACFKAASNSSPRPSPAVKAMADVVPNLRTSVAQIDEAIMAMAKVQRTQAWRELAEGRERLDPTGRCRKGE